MFNRLILLERKNTTSQGVGTVERTTYNQIQLDGSINYSSDAFDYRFNSHGFRCDNFTDYSDLPILFLGCSYTEGIGLPVETIWPNLILNKIRALPQHTNKQIPFWTLAEGGTGSDAMANHLAAHIDIMKPKYIFYHLAHYHRRDYAVPYNRTFKITRWLPTHTGHVGFKDSAVPEEVRNKMFTTDEFALHQLYRSLTTISLAARLHNTKIFIFESALIPPHIMSQIFEDFSNITVIKTIRTGGVMLETLKDRLTTAQYEHFKTRPSVARDNMHPGELWQFMLAEDVWDHIKKEFNN